MVNPATSFFRHILGAKTDEAVQGAIQTVARWAPEATQAAHLGMVEESLDAIGRRVEQARITFQQEKKEADAIVALANQRIAAADLLQKQVEAEPDAAKKASLQKSLDTLLAQIEELQPRVEREKKDAEEAHEFLESLEALYRDKAEQLRTAKSRGDAARREMERSEIEKQRAQDRAQAAREAAGLANASNTLDVALKAMQDVAEKNRADADMLNEKARLLKPSQPEQDDPNIAAAMNAVSGAAPHPQSAAERLAAIKARLR